MRKDNTAFFVAGLVFGILVGYFLSESLARPPSSAGSGGAASRAAETNAPVRRVVDPQMVSRLERQAEERPDDAAVRLELANLYFEAAQYEQAIPWYRQALALEPRNLHMRNHMAIALSNVNRFDEAIDQYEMALEVDPNHPQSLAGLGRALLYGRQDIRGGLEAWEKLMKVAPNSPEAEAVRDELEALRAAHAEN